MKTKYLLPGLITIFLAGCFGAKPVIASKEYQPSKKIVINISSKKLDSKKELEIQNIVSDFCGGETNYALIKQEDVYTGSKVSYGTTYNADNKEADAKPYLATDIDGTRKYDYTAYTYICK